MRLYVVHGAVTASSVRNANTRLLPSHHYVFSFAESLTLLQMFHRRFDLPARSTGLAQELFDSQTPQALVATVRLLNEPDGRCALVCNISLKTRM